MKRKTEQQPTARTRHSRPAVQNVSDTVILQSNWPPLFFFSPFSASAQVSAHLSRIHHTGEEGGDTFFAPFSYLASLGQKIVIGLGKRVCNCFIRCISIDIDLFCHKSRKRISKFRAKKTEIFWLVLHLCILGLFFSFTIPPQKQLFY